MTTEPDRSPVPTVGIPCDAAICNHVDRATKRCALPLPVATQGIKWIFALVECPLAATYADLVAQADGEYRLGLLDPRSRVGRMSQYRHQALRIHESETAFNAALPDGLAPEGGRLIDRVVAKTADPTIVFARSETARVAVLAERARAIGERRRFSPATIAATLVVLLVAFLWLWDRTHPPTVRQPLLGAGADLDLRRVRPGETFHLDVRLGQAGYVSVFFHDEGGTFERWFPPLGRPLGIPWPLTAAPDGTTHRLPPAAGFRAPTGGKGVVVVVWDADFAPDPAGRLVAGVPPLEALRRLWPHVIELPLEVSPR